MPTSLSQLLDRSAVCHHRLCPRQVLGVRMGALAGRRLEIELPQDDKRMFVFMETDGCAADGVSVATGCSVGRRTMRMMDFGKVAATFVDTQTAGALRIHPHPEARRRAVELSRDAASRWHAQLEAYQTIPDAELLIVDAVDLNVDLEAIISRPGLRALCERCGEEILNQREVLREGRVICRSCAGAAYFFKEPRTRRAPHPSRA